MNLHLASAMRGRLVVSPIWKKARWLAVALLLAEMVGPGGAAAVPPQLVVLYVSPDGRDEWSGKLPDPDAAGNNGPLATLTRARDVARQIRAGADKQTRTNVKVLVRGGKYFLPEPLVLDARDSGTEEFPVVYAAYPGEQPILSGGRHLGGWQPYQGKIVQCVIPAALGGKWKFRQLFYNGKCQIRARWPNFEPQNPYDGGWAKMEGPAEPKSEIAFRYKAGAFPRHWAKPTEAEVNFFFGGNWGNNLISIKTIDEKQRIVTLAHGMTCFSKPVAVLPYTSTPAWLTDVQDDMMAFHSNQRYIVENVLEELDQPGEWCLDSQEGKLYFWPPDDAAAPSDVVVPLLDGLVSLRGTSHVVLSGFTFTETNGGDNIVREGMDGVGTMYPVPGWKYCGEAVHLDAAEGCRIENSRFARLGGNAVCLDGACLRNIVCGNDVAEVGACGVMMGGAPDHYPMFNEITDNCIRRAGVMNKYSAGVLLGLSEGNLIGHNRIEHMPDHAINLGNAGRSRNIVEYNELRDTCLECADTGALNCWMEPEPRNGVRQGHIIRYNLIAGTTDRGIYLDNYTSNCHVYGNVVIGTKTAAIFVHGGRNNVIEGNVLANCGNPLIEGRWIDRYMPAMAGFLSGQRFAHNIVYGCRGTVEVYGVPAGRGLSQADENVYYDTTGAALYLERQRQIGLERHSLVADPKFVNPAEHDYRLQPDSPALRLGFEPIDFQRIGPRTHDSRRTRREP
jgi:hypothetical protein